MAKHHGMKKHTRGKHKKGGKTQVYNAQGSHEEHEAEDESPEFRRGGHAKKHKHGGHAEGKMAKERADRKPRGHHGKRNAEGEFEKHKHGGHAHKRAAGGKSPYTSGHHTSMPGEGGSTNNGHEGQRPPLA